MNDITALMATAKGQTVESPYYLAECTVCDKIYPSDNLDGGYAIADTGDYSECYCPHCGAEDSEIVDCTDAERAWNDQQKCIDALVEALEKAQQRIAELESRTVTVKLPEIERPIDGTGYAAAAGERRYKERVVDALSAAGIQVIEGEGQHGGNCE